MKSAPQKIAIIGYGEVGPIFGQAFVERNIPVQIFDIKQSDPASRAVIESRAQASGAAVRNSLEEALQGADLILSCVTASQAGPVAEQVARFIQAGQTFADLNSVSPKVKQDSAAAIEARGANYLECAVMAPVPPQGIQVPILLGGKTAADSAPILNALGWKTQAVADYVGLASAIKLCRSIMIKGIEALCVQSMTAARHFGVEERILTSLAATFPGVGWDKGYEAYLIGRVVEHGQRRSEEMREAAKMLDEIGASSILATAIADVHEEVAQTQRELCQALDEKGALPGWRDSFKAPKGLNK
ncbi:MAG: DUF1932 domain-containing protein [Pigmentiphaga sp.]